MNTTLMYRDITNRIVMKHGGFREKDILNNPYEITRSETWNDRHKVIDIIATVPEQDGYHAGFQIDLVTKSICG